MILLGLEHAKRIAEVPGVVIPESVFQRFSKFESPEDQLKAGIQFASEQVQKIKSSGWSGLYLMSPASSKGILEVLEAGLF
jgi:5,10-methylenetetrahydrofolate reductase